MAPIRSASQHEVRMKRGKETERIASAERLTIPLQDVSKLRAGDYVLLTGKIYTARDRAHKHLYENSVDMKFNVIYHCGPLFKGDEIVGAGPTTSDRMGMYSERVIRRYGVKAVIGKGGMEPSLFKSTGAVYLAAVGGASVLLADCIKSWRKVLDLGPVDSIYEFDVVDFPAVVAIDASGKSLYRN